jgi:hypothetical protein
MHHTLLQRINSLLSILSLHVSDLSLIKYLLIAELKQILTFQIFFQPNNRVILLLPLFQFFLTTIQNRMIRSTMVPNTIRHKL